jgi:hypothetical protein
MTTNADGHDNTQAQAQACGMTADQWRTAKSQANTARTRGKIKATRPISSLWDPIDGQMELFSDGEQ